MSDQTHLYINAWKTVLTPFNDVWKSLLAGRQGSVELCRMLNKVLEAQSHQSISHSCGGVTGVRISKALLWLTLHGAVWWYFV